MVIFNPIKWGFRYSEISPKVKATYNEYATIETNSTETCASQNTPIYINYQTV